MWSYLTRIAVGFTSAILATFVVDSLLQVTEKATEIVMPVEALKELAKEETPKAPEPEASPVESDEPKAAQLAKQEAAAEKAKESAASPPATSEPRESREPREPPGSTEERVASREEETPQAPDVRPKEEASLAEPLGAEARMAVAEAASDQPAIAPMFGLSEAGQLASFGGEGSGDMSGVGALGHGERPVWDVRIRGDVSSRDGSLPTGYVLAGVRTRGNYTEIVPLGPTLPPAPLSHEAFVKQFPTFGSRQGVRLNKQTLLPWRERLLNYDSQGGWQPWLILDDSTFAHWLQSLREAVGHQGRSLSDIAKVTSSIELVRRGTRGNGNLIIENLTWKSEASVNRRPRQ